MPSFIAGKILGDSMLQNMRLGLLIGGKNYEKKLYNACNKRVGHSKSLAQ